MWLVICLKQKWRAYIMSYFWMVWIAPGQVVSWNPPLPGKKSEVRQDQHLHNFLLNDQALDGAWLFLQVQTCCRQLQCLMVTLIKGNYNKSLIPQGNWRADSGNMSRRFSFLFVWNRLEAFDNLLLEINTCLCLKY